MERKLSKPIFTKVETLSNTRDGYNVYVKVVSVEKSMSKNGQLQLARAVVADETASSNAFFKGQDAKLIVKDKVIAIRNGRIRLIKGFISLEVDIFGRVTSENVQIKSIGQKNISQEQIVRKPRFNNRGPRKNNSYNREDRDRRPRNREERPFRNNDNRNYNRNEDNRNYNRNEDNRNYNRNEDNRNYNRNDRNERNDRNDRNDRNNRNDRNERNERNDRNRNDRNDRNERNDRNDRNRNDRGGEKRYKQNRQNRDFRQNRGNNNRPKLEWTKIVSIEPGQEDLNITAKIVSVENLKNKSRVILGDETGTVKGFFHTNQHLKQGNTIVLFRCEAIVNKEHIQMQLMKTGRIDEARNRNIEDVDETVNISAKAWVQSA